MWPFQYPDFPHSVQAAAIGHDMSSVFVFIRLHDSLVTRTYEIVSAANQTRGETQSSNVADEIGVAVISSQM